MYTVSVADRQGHMRSLAFVEVHKKFLGCGMGLGWYSIIDNSKNGWDEFIGCALTFTGADDKAFDRAHRIAALISEKTNLPVVNHTVRGGWHGMPLWDHIKSVVGY